MNEEPSFLSASNQDIIDHLTYRAYAGLARRIPRGVTPNQLTVMNFSCAMVACLCLVFVEHAWGLLAAALFFYLYTLFDALDGIHARLTGQMSRFGHFLDHFLDGFTWLFLYFSVILKFSLFSPLFIFLFLLRILMQSFAFLIQVITGELHLPRLGPTAEAMGYCLGFVITFFYPEPVFVLSSFLKDQGLLYDLLERNQLIELNVIKCILLLYLFGLPQAILGFLQQARKAAES